MPPFRDRFNGSYILQRFITFAALAVLFVLVPTYSIAGSFRATPLRLFIDAKAKTTVLKITNEGDEKVTAQIDAKTWSQDEAGRDIYGETADIVVFPRITTIEKGETRIIRVG
jgi:fimbrial chaperone protein